MIKEREEFVFCTLNSCLLASGSHTSFSTLPPTTNKVVTMPISAQAKMKEKPTPLKEHNQTETSVIQQSLILDFISYFSIHFVLVFKACIVKCLVGHCSCVANIRHQQVAAGV